MIFYQQQSLIQGSQQILHFLGFSKPHIHLTQTLCYFLTKLGFILLLPVLPGSWH